MKTITFTVPGSAPSKKNGRDVFRGRLVSNPAAKAWSADCLKAAQRAAGMRGSEREPWTSGPFRVWITVHRARPKGRFPRGRLPCPRGSDIDGILTSVLDALQGAKVKVGKRTIRVGALVADDKWCVAGPPKLGSLLDEPMIQVTIHAVDPEEYLGILDIPRSEWPRYLTGEKP